MGRWADVDDLVEVAHREFGRIDILVNNAGISPLHASVVAVSEELFDRVIGVALKGPFRPTSLVATRMAAAEGGSIINSSSVAGVMPTPRELPYGLPMRGSIRSPSVSLAPSVGPCA